ncbi:Transcription factor 25 [Acropora cervicornis]|uniref:Transcription factor 25 n=1 Tax=Acropora cervicornis TaxID=6130 RepID=A0AAD9Q4Y9_ACRCE|nr:Transcription factor 25 [Acropora cervicornis]
MSSRVLRKLQGERILEIPPDYEEDEDEDEFGILSVKTKQQAGVNRFDLLNANDDDDVSNEDSQDFPEDENSMEGTSSSVTEEKPYLTESTSKMTKKKNKKAKKGKGDVSNGATKQKGTIDELKNNETDKSANMPGAITTQRQSTSKTLDTKAVLGVEHRNLNAENEMKRRFGSHVIRAENRSVAEEFSPESVSIRIKLLKLHRTERSRSKDVRLGNPTWDLLRKGRTITDCAILAVDRLVTPKQTWPKIGATGIRMEVTETKNGNSFFAFQHSTSYQETQLQFLDAVESLDPNNISAILHTHPYHVDSLLQLSEICKMGEDYQMAAELIGCYRTALELCKLLLNLDPDEDPLGVLLMIDFYALQSEQFTFLIRLFEEWEPHRNLSQLPNFAFSVALAHFHSSKQEGEPKRADEMKRVESYINCGATAQVLSPLLDKCNVALASSLIKHQFCSPASASSYPLALKQLEALYIGRTYHAWKEPEVIDWLAMNVKIVLERVDAKDPMVEQCKSKRQVRYRGTPRNVYRHIIMSDIKDATASLPQDMTNVPLVSYDPLPPLDSVSGYKRPQRNVRVDQEHGVLSMFFRSLLPSFNAQTPNGQRERLQARLEQPVEGAEGAPSPLRDTDLTRGVENLLTAMRELLNTLSYRDPSESEQNDATGENGANQEEWDDGGENY